MFQTSAIKFNKLLAHESGSYNRQYGRSFTTQLTGRTENLIAERIGAEGAITAASMATIANQFIIPSSTPDRVITPSGVEWSERRMRFALEVEASYGGIGAKNIIMVLGYTNHLGLSHNGSLDPNMTFHVNSIVTMRETVVPGPYGPQTIRSIADNSHILADNNFTGLRTSGEVLQRMRPEDVYTTMTRAHVPDLGQNVFDQRTSMTKTPTKSSRSNNIPTNFMATILNNHVQAKASEDFGQNPQDAINAARTNSHELSALSDPFLSALSAAQNGNMSMVFTMRDLIAIDPNIVHVMKASFMTDTKRAQTHVAGQSQEWGGSDVYTLFATILSQSIPSLMMDLMMTQVKFTATNRHVDGQHKVSVVGVQTFTEMDMTAYGNAFLFRVVNEILNDLTYGNTMSYYLEMTVDLLGETRLELALNSDNNPVPFVTPSFCDALLVPVVTSDASRAVTLAGDFNSLATNLSSMLHQSNNPVAMPSGTRSY